MTDFSTDDIPKTYHKLNLAGVFTLFRHYQMSQ